MKRAPLIVVLAVFTAVVTMTAGYQGSSAQMQPAPRTLTVLVGGGQDTMVFDTFFPQTLRVRVGDTVTWKFNADPSHRHTVTLTGGPFPGPKDPVAGGRPGEALPGRWLPVPGGAPGALMRNPAIAAPTRPAGAPTEAYDGAVFVNSGELSSRTRLPGMTKNESFSVSFTKPGTYRYYCAVHRPHMVGIVEVLPATATNVPDQAQIDAQAKAEIAHLVSLVDKAKQQTKAGRKHPGPHDTTFWFVRSGGYELPSAELRGMAFEYLPKTLTIKAGDTVIWESVDGHTVTFVPGPTPPQPLLAKPQGDAYPMLVRNPLVFTPAKPAAIYDPAQHFNSGPIGQTSPNGTSWALTFDKPGVYEYLCAFHHEVGMKGTITVVDR